ncbi:TetR/AcrR family transcriptional regulator [Actinotalea sp. M2MS4P-6]|uniref:TetR/AcrR family transcriptional regulator n=1 Tax=Actinotalea sp. M2MS4P-6 TaxID=2983762 RepID=UPI0021E4E7D8|nr:TetR/AcrR family transcriptional regulator [Actinotalea sp. M2MS4P-6]MCV2393626.1 TetR/AcrR family transcriptional regulator [Actinotalea sp. M2MS4P-6]
MPKVIDTDAVFRAAVDVFVERGYDGTTTQEIARRAGVNEVTLFRRWGTKSALVSAALTHALSTTPFASLSVGPDVGADLRAMLDAFGATTSALGGAVATLLTEVARHPELRDATAPLLVNLRGAVRVIEAHQEGGALGGGDPWELLVLLAGPVMAAGLWSRSGVPMPVTIDPDRVVSAFLDGHRGAAAAAPGRSATPGR